jgi:hypothetical protein
MKFLLVVVLAIAPAIARGEDKAPAASGDIASYETEGDADAGGPDPRVAALDDAFAAAVASALADLVDAESRKTHKVALDQHVIGRARLWVSSFKPVKDVTVDNRRQLTVIVRVDRDKMRARLAELQIIAAPDGSGGARPTVILLRISAPDGVRASYGAAAERELPGLGALSATLRGAGMTIKRAPASGPAPRAGVDLPLDDTEADALAAEVKAEAVAVAGVSVGEPVPVRGLATPAVLVTAHVRLIENKKAIGQGSAVVAARGSEPSAIAAAIDQALVAAATDVLPPAKTSLAPSRTFTGDDMPIAEPGVVLVRLPAKTPWGLVAAEQKYLSGAKGVQRAVVRRVSPGGWVIGVTTTESIERIAAIAKKPPIADVTPRVKVVGEIIEVALGAP